MANVQTYFNKFHDNIRRSYEDNSTLRERRDLLLDDLRDGLQRYAQNHNVKIPRFEHFNQGSYAMGTGIEPLPSEDYDIDVGLEFHLSKNDCLPVEVKKWVHDALDTGNRTVEYKRPCIRVQYHRAGVGIYHVDLAVYSESIYNSDNQTYLAKGFLGSAPENQIWEVAEPKKLIDIFQQKFQYQRDQDQFRRAIRFLKRWKDFKFRTDGHERPTGIAITACALNWFQRGTRYNPSDGKNYYDDLTALKNLAQVIINQFDWWTGRMSVRLPVRPHNDLFEKMSDRQMEVFKSRLEAFRDSLSQVELTVDTLTSCHILQDVFGSDFPTP